MIASRKALIVVAAFVLMAIGLPWGGNVPAAFAQITVTEWEEGPRHGRRQVLHTPRGDLTSAEFTEPGVNSERNALGHIIS